MNITYDILNILSVFRVMNTYVWIQPTISWECVPEQFFSLLAMRSDESCVI